MAELKLKTTADTKRLLKEYNIVLEDFEKWPRKMRDETRNLQGKSLEDIKKICDEYPPHATLHAEHVCDYDDDFHIDLEVQWERPETDDEWARRVLNETVQARRIAEHNAAHERETYERLRLKYGDMVEIHVDQLNEQAKQMMGMEELWQRHKAEALKKGIKIVGEDGNYPKAGEKHD